MFVVKGTRYSRSVGDQEGQFQNMTGDNGIVHSRAMSGGRDDTREGLVRNGTDVAHCQTVLPQSFMQHLQRYSRLSDDIMFLDVDLQVESNRKRKKCCESKQFS